MDSMRAAMGLVGQALDVSAALFVFAVFAIGIGAVAVVWMFIADCSQTKDAVRQNFPVLDRFRHLFSKLGEFFRHYFLAMYREEMLFNRAHCNWIDAATRGADNTIAFGSTKDVSQPGTVLFVNHPFPDNETNRAPCPALRIGPHCGEPYDAPSFSNLSAMSYAAISRPAVQALSRGAARAGCWMNTGEGGLAPFHIEGGCDIVFQFGTAQHGVRDAEGRLSDARLRDVTAHRQVRIVEIKLSQGAKPGKGGILPAAKVTPEIAAIRGIPVAQAWVSPNRHEDIVGVEDLLDMVHRIRAVTGKPVGFKPVFGDTVWLEHLCTAITRRGEAAAPDFITVDGGDGGTGAAQNP